MNDNQIVDSSFSAVINAPIDKVDIPAWCFDLPESEYRATVRFAAELGYDVTVVKDAVADYSDEMMHAALELNMPNYASAIVTTQEILGALSFENAGSVAAE